MIQRVEYNPKTQSFKLPSGDEIAAELIWECLVAWHGYVTTVPEKIEQMWEGVAEVRKFIKASKSNSV